MSRDVTTPLAGQRPITGRQQASLRDHLNERVAPYLKKALIAGLNNDVEFPLQWLGEHLISLSMLHEGNPDSTNIKAHFKYNHDAPSPPPSAPAEIKTESQPRENASMSNGVANGETHTEYVNGRAFPETLAAPAVGAAPAAAPTAAPTATPAEELQGTAEATAQEDTEMQGTA